jgi:hypothetical protein
MMTPELNGLYEIELCSGERLFWIYLGPDEGAAVWWRDRDTGREFNESSLMYSWRIVVQHDSYDSCG